MQYVTSNTDDYLTFLYKNSLEICMMITIYTPLKFILEKKKEKDC